VDPGAIAVTTTTRKVAASRVYLDLIPSRCHCPHQQTIIGRRTRGAIMSCGTSPLASWVVLRLLCLTDT
jgi:hypothetical protein